MTKKWLVWRSVLVVFAFVWLTLPYAAQGAEKKSVDVPVVAQPHPAAATDSDIEKRLDQIDNDLETILGDQDKIKEKLKQNRLEWSGSLRITSNNYHFKDRSIVNTLIGFRPTQLPVYDRTQLDSDRWFGSAWVSRLRLTMAYAITEKLRFYGQIVGYKYFNLTKENAFLLDMVQTRYPLDSGLRVERAYFDWFITDWLTLSAGRVASPEGPPAELKENSERNATWGVQMVEAAMDTILVTFNLSSLIESTYLRLSYMPYANFADVRGNDNSLFSNDGFKEMHVFTSLYEMKIPALGSNVFQLGFSLVPKFGTRNNAIFVDQPWCATPNDPIYPDKTTLPDDLGLLSFVNTLLELKDIYGTGLDLFGAFALTILDPNDKYMTYNVPVKKDSLSIMVNENTPIMSYPRDTVPVQVGLASFDDPKEGPHFGQFVYVGIRYSPTESVWSFFKDYPFRVGVEFNRGTKYHFTFASPSDLLFNKFGLKGNAYELYVIQQLVPGHLFIRLGYLFVERQYAGSYLGPTTKVNQLIHNAYALIDASW